MIVRMSDIKKISLNIKNSAQAYDISIGFGLISKIAEIVSLDSYSKVVILSDSNVSKHYLESLQSSLSIESSSIIIEPGESQKHLKTIENIWRQMFKLGIDRKSLLINLGGGVIGDLGGFAASTYMRGIDFVNIPTTTLSAADASIGGKTGFNFAGLKNMIGSFAQPKAVIIDVDTFKTLDKRIYNEGFAEIIKHAAISDADYFDYLENVLPNPTEDQLVKILEKSCQIKAGIVSADEKESGERKKVNFGHTIGHALESLSHQKAESLMHGEAVAIGMVAEAKLGQESGFTEPGTSTSLTRLLGKVSLPTEIPAWANQEELDAKIIKDKKNTNLAVSWVLLEKIGSSKFDVSIN